MKIGIIGTGLIGGSLGLALKRSKKHKVFCYNRRLENSKKAINLKAADKYFESIEELAENSDVIIIATPLSTYMDICKKISKYLDGKKIISDVGSVKYQPTQNVQSVIPEKYKSFFVPAHPIAGKEKGSIENADADLYKNKKLIICKTPSCKKGKKIAEIWKDAGSNIEFMNAQKHDEIYAYVSHYVQYLSFACAKHLPKTMGEFSRLMNSPKEMWSEIFEFNSANINKVNWIFMKALDKNIKINKSGKARNKHHFTAMLIARTLQEIIPQAYVKYAGTGFKSFTSITKEASPEEIEIKPSEVKLILNKIKNELKKSEL